MQPKQYVKKTLLAKREAIMIISSNWRRCKYEQSPYWLFLLKTVLDAFFGKNSFEALLPFSLKKLISSSLKGRFPKWNISVCVIFQSVLCLNGYLGIIFEERKERMTSKNAVACALSQSSYESQLYKYCPISSAQGTIRESLDCLHVSDWKYKESC